MITLKINQVPLCLQKSQLYRTLIEDQDEITIPEKYHLELNKSCNFANVLNTLRYWMVDEIPHQVYDYVYRRQMGILPEFLYERFKDFTPFIDEIIILSTSYPRSETHSEPLKHKIKLAIKNNYIGLLKYLHPQSRPYNKYSLDYCETAAKHDSLECLIYLRKQGCKWDNFVYKKALDNDSKRCLEYLDKKRCLEYLDKKRCPKPQPTYYVPLSFWHTSTSNYVPYTSLPFNNVNFNLTFNHPVKELNWVNSLMKSHKPKPSVLLLTNG